MEIKYLDTIFSQSYDCILFVHPYIQKLERISNEISKLGVAYFNVSKELSTSLMPISTNERSSFSQKWFMNTLTSFENGPILCTCPDLLFDPSLEIDPYALFRQAARGIRLIVLWPGEYSSNTLSYAVPEHHHFRTWKVTDALLRQPKVLIHQISTSQGA
ncbi:MAG: BREX-3 system P-loop-containing protein BrxF [Anaerolineaceae bacterium]